MDFSRRLDQRGLSISRPINEASLPTRKNAAGRQASRCKAGQMSLGFLTFQKGSPPCCPTPGPRFVGSETSPWKLRQTSRKGKKNCSECARAQSCCCHRLVAQLYPILCDPMDCSLPGSSVHGKSPGKNAGVSCHFLLQGVFLPQGLNLGLLQCREILYHLSHQTGNSQFT